MSCSAVFNTAVSLVQTQITGVMSMKVVYLCIDEVLLKVANVCVSDKSLEGAYWCVYNQDELEVCLYLCKCQTFYLFSTVDNLCMHVC